MGKDHQSHNAAHAEYGIFDEVDAGLFAKHLVEQDLNRTHRFLPLPAGLGLVFNYRQNPKRYHLTKSW